MKNTKLLDKAKTEIVKSRVDSELKNSVEAKLKLMGVNPAEIIRMLYAQIDLQNKIPFEITLPHKKHIPNKKTLEVMDKTDKGKELHDVSSIDQLKKELL
jgi:DNA-damage-inducible protein J